MANLIQIQIVWTVQQSCDFDFQHILDLLYSKLMQWQQLGQVSNFGNCAVCNYEYFARAKLVLFLKLRLCLLVSSFES